MLVVENFGASIVVEFDSTRVFGFVACWGRICIEEE
jgi:hypothetical protein